MNIVLQYFVYEFSVYVINIHDVYGISPTTSRDLLQPMRTHVTSLTSLVYF